MSRPYQIAKLYASVWERYFESKFRIGSGECKAAKELIDVPQDEILEKARIHCTDLWHKDNCRGSIYCFVKNYNSFSIPKKPKEIRHRVPCRTCGEEYWLDEIHDCGTDVEVINPNEGINLLMKKWKA